MVLVTLALLFVTGPVYAADCITSFDQTCLTKDYNAEQIEADRQAVQADIEEFQQAKEEEATIAAKEEEKQLTAEEQERRHQERLAVEEEKVAAERAQATALHRVADEIQRSNLLK